MKRVILLGAALAAACSLTPQALASPVTTDLVATNPDTAGGESVPVGSMSSLNPLLNRIPVLQGPDKRHICLISDQVDRSWCFYVAIP